MAKEAIKGAGIMFITPDDEALFLLRSPDANHPNEWDMPGGKADDDETPEETARREAHEEVGATPYGELEQLADTSSDDDSGKKVDFITYRQFIRHKFTPKLDKSEHTAFVWRKLKDAPEPLHPGVSEVVNAALGITVAKDSEHWISTEAGSHILLNGEGEVIGGASGKLNGQKLNPQSKSKDVTKAGASAAKPFNAETDFDHLESTALKSNLSEGQRNDIARSNKLYEKYGEKGEGSRGKFKEAGRAGKLDHLYDEHMSNVKSEADAEKAAKKAKSEPYRQKAMARIESEAHAKAAEQSAKIEAAQLHAAAESERQSRYESEKRVPFEKPSDHETLNKPRKISKETDSAYGIENPYVNGDKNELVWVPKSQSSAHGGEVKSMSPWMADKLKLGTKEGAERKVKQSNERNYLNVPYAEKDKAKAAGARWDSEKKKWYHAGGDLPESLKQYSNTTPSTKARSVAPSMPTHGRINGDDPSVWGSELLGHEGELWSDFHNRHTNTKFDALIEPGGYDSAFDCGYTSDQITEMDSENSSMAMDSMAFDRASVRSIDQDGRMHVALTPISKAMVCKYYGHEIPKNQELGLDPNHLYSLLRDPEELAKSVPTWNGLQLLNEHVPVDSKDHKPALVIGSTGTDAVFQAPYLMQSLSIWTDDAVKGVEDKTEHEISSCYYYDCDMTPGIYEGVRYDAVMRNIVGNHVILCEKGRSGPDVRVAGDSIKFSNALPFNGALNMGNKSLSRKAAIVRGALIAVAPRLLAADSAIDLNAILTGVKRKNWLDRKPGIVAAIKPHLAKDADIADIVELLDKLDGEQPDDDSVATDEPDPKTEGILGKLRGKISDEDLSEIEAMLKAAPAGEVKPAAVDEPVQTEGGANADPKNGENKETLKGMDDKDGKEEPMDKKAMDKAIKVACDAAAKDAEAKTIARLRGIAEAEQVVAPYVGKLTAMDSADAVYKAALDIMKVDIKDVHPSAYKAVLTAHAKPGEQKRVTVAQDAAPTSEIAACFPDLFRV